MILRMSRNAAVAVRSGPQGTYEIVEVNPDRPESEWELIATREWLDQSVELAERVSKTLMSSEGK